MTQPETNTVLLVEGCRIKNQVVYALALNLVRSRTRSKYPEIEREVFLDNHKQHCLKKIIGLRPKLCNTYYNSICLKIL